MSSRYPKLILGVPVLCALVALACSAPQPEKSNQGQDQPFVVGVVTWVGSGPFFLAKNKGLFGDSNVQISIIDDAAGRRAALSQGSIQAMAATVDDFANAAAAGLPAVAILKTDDSFGGDGIVASADIKTVKDLAGKTVAFPQGMPSHFFLIEILKRNGLSLKDLNVRYMEAGQAGAAFVAGKVDAAVTWEPWLSKAAEREGGHVLVTTRDSPGLISDIVVASRDAAANRAGDVTAFVRGWFSAVDYLHAHPKDSNALMAKALSLPLDQWDSILAGIRYSDLANNRDYFGLGGSPSKFDAVFTTAGEVWQRQGLVDKPASATDHVDTRFLMALSPE
jgi:NitT/TauT family transport system substrate-binding protein